MSFHQQEHKQCDEHKPDEATAAVDVHHLASLWLVALLRLTGIGVKATVVVQGAGQTLVMVNEYLPRRATAIGADATGSLQLSNDVLSR